MRQRMKQPAFCWICILIFSVLSIYWISTSAHAASTTVTEAELKKLTKLDEKAQKEPANQARLQAWFFQQVEHYRGIVQSTLIGKSKLVKVGPSIYPFGEKYLKTFAPPTGNGKYVVLWGDDVNNPSTGYYGTIKFPRANITITGGNDSTCWHESLHAIFWGSKPSVTVMPYNKWVKYKPGENYEEARDHVYIEVLAESTFRWFGTLSAFEKRIVEAADAQKELKERGITVNYEVENAVWAKAHEAWRTVWHFTEDIATIPQFYREEFERLTEVCVPFVEDVVAFYMSGEIKVPAGSAFKHPGTEVKVPQWVMWPDKLEVPAIIRDTNLKKPVITGNDAVGSVDVRVLELRNSYHLPLTRGTVSFSLRSNFPGVNISVNLAGRAIPAAPVKTGDAYHSFVANLADPFIKNAVTKDEAFHVVVTLKNGAKLSAGADVVLPLHVLYKDVPNKPNAEGLYAPTDAVFVFRVKGEGAGAQQKQSSASVSSQGSAAIKSSRGYWVLIKKDHFIKIDQPGRVKSYSFNEGCFKALVLPKNSSDYIEQSDSWDIPPNILYPGDEIWLNCNTVWIGNYCSGLAKRPFGVYAGSTTDYYPSLVILVKVGGMQIYGGWIYTYEWRGPATKPATAPVAQHTAKINTEVVREKKLQPVPDKRLGDEPPEPGDIIPITKGDEPPPTNQPKLRWFTHAEGDYRICLKSDWQQVIPSRIKNLDHLQSDTGQYKVFVGLGHNQSSDPLNEMNKLAGEWLAENKGSHQISINIGGEPAVAVGIPAMDGNTPIIVWHIVMSHRERYYYIGVYVPISCGLDSLPTEVYNLLTTIEFLR